MDHVTSQCAAYEVLIEQQRRDLEVYRQHDVPDTSGRTHKRGVRELEHEEYLFT